MVQTDTADPSPGEQPEAELVLKGVTKQYGSFTAVNDLSFSVRPGEIYGFLGQNGAGKTTTLRMIMDIVPPTGGEISVLGSTRPRSVKRRVGYLPEERGLYRKMKCRDTIAYFARLKGVPGHLARRRADELLDRFGLGQFAKAKIETLSKGMAQKVQLLSCIAHEPELLILDEPFSGLDPVNQQVLEDMIRNLREEGRTIIFSTHVMEHAERLCDRFLMIRKGTKVFEGTLEDARATDEPTLILQTPDDPLPLMEVPGIIDIMAQDQGRYKLVVTDKVDRQEILKACIRENIRVEFFGRAHSSLHDIFFRLAGADPISGQAT
ncbi:ABC transporter ATP-binding protein [Parvularcula sp. LCG005]|uniref:ABC transporter ATP-binding protein n=1 Tax=Parvularcula sp. LCG005 TaxID=3078805 RepID=UPI002942E33A|nr:ATP-binding cassette domain-containing protein [Parvularcula sp. LCG005]WOI54787.1 ATP-binding cassette domain-containing protein [Parvularcula sp. LCG005]